jgi:hypothetical protein
MARSRAKKVPSQTRVDRPPPPSSPPIPRSASWESPPLSPVPPVPSQSQVLENESLHASADTDSVPSVFKAKTKVRSSHVWLPENGKEVLVNGILRWQCQRCKRLPPSCYCVSPLTDRILSRPKSINRRYLCHGNYQKRACTSPVKTCDRRCRMGDDAVEALECLKSWQRDGLIAASRLDIKAMEDMLNALCQEDLEE